MLWGDEAVRLVVDLPALVDGGRRIVPTKLLRFQKTEEKGVGGGAGWRPGPLNAEGGL